MNVNGINRLFRLTKFIFLASLCTYIFLLRMRLNMKLLLHVLDFSPKIYIIHVHFRWMIDFPKVKVTVCSKVKWKCGVFVIFENITIKVVHCQQYYLTNKERKAFVSTIYNKIGIFYDSPVRIF